MSFFNYPRREQCSERTARNMADNTRTAKRTKEASRGCRDTYLLTEQQTQQFHLFPFYILRVIEAHKWNLNKWNFIHKLTANMMVDLKNTLFKRNMFGLLNILLCSYR